MSEVVQNQDDPNVFSDHAMIKSTDTKVLTIVNVPGDFAVSGYIFIKIQSGVYCIAGMFYDTETALFYDDEAFTSINGVEVAQYNSAGQMESAA